MPPMFINSEMAAFVLTSAAQNMEENQFVGKRLLLVEDDRGVREMLKTALSNDACTVVEANNGAEAFGLFRNGRFDLVMIVSPADA